MNHPLSTLFVCAVTLGACLNVASADPEVSKPAEDPTRACDGREVAQIVPAFCEQWRSENWWKALQIVERLNQPNCMFTYCYRSTLTARLLEAAKTFRETDQLLVDYDRCQRESPKQQGLAAIQQQAKDFAGPLVTNVRNEQRSHRLKLAGGVVLGVGAATLILSSVGVGYEKGQQGILTCDGGGFTFDCTDRLRAAYGIGFAVSTSLLISGAVLLGIGHRSVERQHVVLPQPRAYESPASAPGLCDSNSLGAASPSTATTIGVSHARTKQLQLLDRPASAPLTEQHLNLRRP